MENQKRGYAAKDVANAFVARYYAVLHKCPENVHKFYQECSLLGWPGLEDAIIPVTTLQGINDKIMSSDFKDWPVEIKSVDAQESIAGGIIVVATGLIQKDNSRKYFNQTFFLAEQEKGFYVLNDIFKLTDVCESLTDVDDHNDNVNDQVAPFTKDPEPSNVPDCPAASHPEADVENENGKEPSVLSVIKDVAAEVSVSKPAVASRESVSKLPVSSRKSVSKLLVASGENENPLVAPVSNVREGAQKVSYASMLAKESPATSKVSANVDQQPAGSPVLKASTPVGDGASKISTHSSITSNNIVTDISTHSNVTSNNSGRPNSVAPNESKNSNIAPNFSGFVEARGIYIGDLPYGITKSGVLDVVKRFGQVRRSPDSIQIRTHEDGFSCGFVEFESSESARRAVEARYVFFGEKESYITYKRTHNQGGNGRGKFPGRDGYQRGNFRSVENDEGNGDRWFQYGNRTGYEKGQATAARRSRQADQ